MGQIAPHGVASAPVSYRCPRCRDTGMVGSDCPRDCGSHPIPCSCQDGSLLSQQERTALRVELLIGVPFAGAVIGLLAAFH